MTSKVQQGTILDVLKSKMRQTKEEMEKYKDDCEEMNKRLQVEIMRREEVRATPLLSLRRAASVLSADRCHDGVHLDGRLRDQSDN